jgi:hypothetical protein
LLASGLTRSSGLERGNTLWRLTRPEVSLSPTVPTNAAGKRMESLREVVRREQFQEKTPDSGSDFSNIQDKQILLCPKRPL